MKGRISTRPVSSMQCSVSRNVQVREVDQKGMMCRYSGVRYTACGDCEVYDTDTIRIGEVLSTAAASRVQQREGKGSM